MSTRYPIPRQARRQDFVASAGQTSFGVTDFKVYDGLDLRVRVRSAAGTFRILPPSAWTAVLSGPAPSSPTITLASGRAGGDVVRIEGARLPARLSDVTLAGIVRSVPLETELDRIAIALQEARRDQDDTVDRMDVVDEAVSTVTVMTGRAVDAAGTAVSSRDSAVTSAAAAAISAAEAERIALGDIQPELDELAAYRYPLPQTLRRTKDAKLGDAAPTPFDFLNLVVGGDWTAAVQAGLNASAAAQLPLALFRPFPVTSLTVPRFASIHSGGGELRAIGTGARDSINALLNLPDGNVVVHGRLVVNGQYNLAYRRGVQNFGQQSQFSFPTNLGINGFQVGYTHGSKDFPHGILSEATITGLYTYGCPICVEVIGTETIVNFVGCPLISDVFGAPVSWSSLPRRVVRSIGASAYLTAGQACITDTPNGYVAEMQPQDSTRPTIEGTRYGAVRFYNLEMETASPFLLAHNPAGLAVNSPANRSYFSIDNCGGFVSQDLPMSFIADDAPIDVVIGDNEFPFPGGKRTQPTWFINGTAGRAHIYLPSKPMGMNWRDPLDEVVNGVAHWHGERTIFRALNPNGQSFVANTPSTVVYRAVDQSEGLNRFAGGYNTTNGRWQVLQSGGLKDVTAIARMTFTTPVSGRVIVANQAGAEMGSAPIGFGVGTVVADIGKMGFGDFLEVKAIVTADAVTTSDNSGGGFTNKLTIKARN